MPDNKTQRLLSKWQINANAVAQAEDNLVLAKDHLSRASSELGNWLTPNDALSGESFNIWARGSLLVVTILAGGTKYKIKYRTEQKRLEEE